MIFFSFFFSPFFLFLSELLVTFLLHFNKNYICLWNSHAWDICTSFIGVCLLVWKISLIGFTRGRLSLNILTSTLWGPMEKTEFEKEMTQKTGDGSWPHLIGRYKRPEKNKGYDWRNLKVVFVRVMAVFLVFELMCPSCRARYNVPREDGSSFHDAK